MLHLQYTRQHRDKPQNFWNKVIWSDETKIELFGNNHEHHIWRRVRWKVHHSYCETWRWIADVLGLCELQRHKEPGQNWWQDECSMLAENTGGKIALISMEAAHGMCLDVPSCSNMMTCHWLQQKHMKFLELLSQSPDISIIEPLWGDLKAQEFTGGGDFLSRSMGSFTIWENKGPHPKLPPNVVTGVEGATHSIKNQGM